MWEKIVLLIISIMTSTTVLVSLIMHTWIETIGSPQKRYGLLRVEIIGCGKTSQGTGAIANAMSGTAAITTALEKVANLGCYMMTTDSMEGEMTYQEYTVGTCKAATNSQCTLARAASVLDPTNWCETLRQRCGNLQQIWRLNEGLWYFLVLGICANLLGAALTFKYDPRSCSMAGSLTSLLSILSVILMFIFHEEEYAEPPPISNSSVTEFGMAFWISSMGGILALGQMFAACCLLEDSEAKERKEEKKREKEKEKERLNKKQKHSKGAKDEHLPHYGNYNATDDESMAIADQVFGNVIEAIRQRGYSDVAQAFQAFDTNGSGRISADEFNSVSHQLGFALTPQQVQWLMNKLDLNKDGGLDYNEFNTQVLLYSQRLAQV